MHLNISSLLHHIFITELLKPDLTMIFKIIGVTESRLRPNKTSLDSIDLPSYNIQHMPTKSDKGGAFLYLSKDLNYKVKSSLQIYKKKLT